MFDRPGAKKVGPLFYILGGIPFVRNHIEIILIGVVVLSVLPVAVNYLRARTRTTEPAA